MTEYGIFEKFDKTKMQWSRWVERFEGTLEIIAPEDVKKLPLLLIYMGSETYDLLCDKLAPVKPKNKTYDEIKTVLKGIYDPDPLEIMENYRYHLRKQSDDETVEEFSIALRKLAIHCNFGDYLTTALRNQFVFGLRSARIQNRLLETSRLTIELALTTAKALELSAKGGAEIQQQKDGKASVNYIQQRNKKSKGKTFGSNDGKSSAKSATGSKSDDSKLKKKEFCYRCGKPDHRANKCSHQNSTCSFCKTKGHLQAVCFKARNEKKQTNYIDDNEATDSMEELFHIKSTDNFQNIRSKFCIQLKVNDVFLGFEIDSGSPVTIIGEDDKQHYFRENRVLPTDTKLVSYCGNEIKVLGFFAVRVDSGIESRNLKLYVVKSKRKPLLGREWLRELKLNWNEIFNSNENAKFVSSIQQQKKAAAGVDQLKQKYSTVFEQSMGKIRNVQARIRLQANAEPMFVKARKLQLKRSWMN